MNNTVVTIKGGWNTSMQILLDTAHRVGDILDMSNITRLVPEDVNFTTFFNAFVRFCSKNDGSRQYLIEDIAETPDGYQMKVSPVKA